jgi:hypothetical protein
MGHHVKTFHRSVGHQPPMLEIEFPLFLRCSFDHLRYEGEVIRVHALHHRLDRRLYCRVVAEDSKAFVGPKDFTAQGIPAEAACGAQLLRLGKVGRLASLQRLLDAFLLGNIAEPTARGRTLTVTAVLATVIGSVPG